MSCDEILKRLLAHLYEALDDDEDREVREHLEDCETCREALAAAREEKEVLALAARGSGEGMTFRPPRDRRLRVVTRGRLAAAAVLLLLLGGLLLYRAALRAPVLAGNPRLALAGPAAFPADEPAEFTVRAETVQGDPLPVNGEARLNDIRGETLVRRPFSARGDTTVRFPANSAPAGSVVRFALVAEVGKIEKEAVLTARAEHPDALAYVSTDKPLYRPGEMLRARAVVLSRFRLTPVPDRPVTFRLLGPGGDEVLRTGARTVGGVAAADFALASNLPGGEYVLELESPEGDLPVTKRKLDLRTYRVPRLTMDLELDRQSYGPGEAGEAWLSVAKAEGGVPAGATVRASLDVDGEKSKLGSIPVPESGALTIPFALPAKIDAGRAVLTAIVSDGGNVEAAAKTVPVSLGRLDVELLPEGGELVAGLPGRIYFRARSPAGEPAELVADVVDADGRKVAEAATDVEGMGRFDLVPDSDGLYRLVPRRPADVTLTGAEIRPVEEGIALRSLFDSYPAGEEFAFRVTSTFAGMHEIVAACRGREIARREAELEAGEPATVSLSLPPDVGGVVRVTVFDPDGRPRAERLVSRDPARRLSVTLAPDREAVSPGEPVKLGIRTEVDGKPVRAALGLSVVDDALLALADDEDTAPLPLHFLLGEDVLEIENASLYAGGPAAARATDLLLGTQGWRRFAWLDPETVLAEHPDRARAILARRANADRATADNLPYARSAASAGLRRADEKTFRAGGLLLVILGVGAGFVLLARVRPIRLVPAFGALGAAAAGALLVVMAAGPRDAEVSSVAAAPVSGEASSGPDLAVVDALLPEAGAPQTGAPAGDDLEIDPSGPAPRGVDPATGVFFEDGLDGDWRGRAKNVFARELGRVLEDRPGVLGRVFAYTARTPEDGERRDFAEVLYWNPLVVTDEDGRAEIEFETSDSITTFRAIAEGNDAAGGLGRAEATVTNRVPFYLSPKLPAELSARDVLSLPVAVANSTNEDMDVDVTLSGTGFLLRLPGKAKRRVRVPAGGRARELFDLIAGDGRGAVPLTLDGRAPGGLSDRVTRTVSVVPRGYPIEVAKGGVLDGEKTTVSVVLPAEMDRAALAGSMKLYPSALSTLVEGLESLLRTPGGCFEQASSTNYPNVLILSWLRETKTAAPELARRARGLLDRGYELLTGYECDRRGYEWFGADPANPALTAYGLLEFTDMAAVHDVDQEMIDRTREWLFAGRDGEGGFEFPSSRALDSFGRAPEEITGAYVLWALAEAGAAADLDPEFARLSRLAKQSDDPYLVALAALALGKRGDGAGGLVAKLAAAQAEDGSLTGKTTSITSSRGANLTVETTALAALAFLRDPARRGEGERAIRYLLSARKNGGRFGATQATILALKALLEHARQAGATGECDLTLFVNGRVVGHGHVHEGMREAVEWTKELTGNLVVGGNEIDVLKHGEGELPFALSLEYHTLVPPTDPECAVKIQTALAVAKVREGETVGLTVTIENREEDGIPMVLARVGLPAGLTPRAGRLEDLVEAGEIAYFETRPREVALYLRGMAPGEAKRVELELTAEVPGRFTGPATSAYLYYTDDVKWWAEPLSIEIEASR